MLWESLWKGVIAAAITLYRILFVNINIMRTKNAHYYCEDNDFGKIRHAIANHSYIANFLHL